MRVTVVIEFNLPAEQNPDRLPAKIIVSDRASSLRIIDLLLRDRQDSVPTAPI